MRELNIDVICANTPQAKGRVERAHLTLQDRRVKELRLQSISSIEAGNAFLPLFMADYNRRFTCEPQGDHDAHRPVDANALDDVFQWKDERRMGQNLTVHYNRVMYLVEPTDDQKVLRGKRINVTESAEGAVRLWNASKEVTATPFAKMAA